MTESSWTPDGAPLHFERGTLRPVGDGRVDLALAHPIGVAEVAEGTVDGTTVTTGVDRDRADGHGGSPVTEIERRYRPVEDDLLSYELDMAMEGVARTFHVRATPPAGRDGWPTPPGPVAGVARDVDPRSSRAAASCGSSISPTPRTSRGSSTTVLALASLLRDVVDGLLRRQPGVDVIALLAMGGSLALEEYLAGAVIALMLASGEALESYADRRAHRELSALLDRAPRTSCLATRTASSSSDPVEDGAPRRPAAREAGRRDPGRRRRLDARRPGRVGAHGGVAPGRTRRR